MPWSERRLAIVLFVAVLMIPVAAVVVNVTRIPPPPWPSVPGTTPIDHVVVIMKENHAFDNYFGTFPGADGLPANVSLPDGSGGFVTPHWLGTTWTWDLPHDRAAMLADYNGGRNDGFAIQAAAWSPSLANVTVGYYDAREIPDYWSLAENYTLADRYFQPMFGPTIPNRAYSVAGTNAGLTSNTIPGNKIDVPTIFNQLEDRHISWKYYYTSSPVYAPFLDYFPQVTSNADATSRIVSIDALAGDIRAGDLPQVAYVDPEADLLLSEHPPGDVTQGEQWTMGIIRSIMAGPQWNSTAIILTWDESGGFYDHVPPPQVDAWGYGFRVPTLIISPYAKRGYVDHDVMDHVSILKFIATNWNLTALTPREAQANDMFSAFNFGNAPAANTDAGTRVPSTAPAFEAVQGVLPQAVPWEPAREAVVEEFE